jgi:hypothetical protein
MVQRRNLLFAAVTFGVLTLLLISYAFDTRPAAIPGAVLNTTTLGSGGQLPAELFAAEPALTVASTFTQVEFWGPNKRAERLAPALDALAELTAAQEQPAAEDGLVLASGVPGTINLLDGLTASFGEFTAPTIDSSVALSAPEPAAEVVLASTAPRSPAVDAIAQTFRGLVDRVEEGPVGSLLGFH